MQARRMGLTAGHCDTRCRGISPVIFNLITIVYYSPTYMYSNNNTQMVAVVLGPWASHLEDRAEP